MKSATPSTRTQAERRQATREALLASAASALSSKRYDAVTLEGVARDAGYSRGAIYHLFANKEALALEAVNWVESTWYEEVGPRLQNADAAQALRDVAKAHAVFCRREVAGIVTNLGVQFAGQDHPIGRAVTAARLRVVADCEELIIRGRRDGSLSAGVDARSLAAALVGAVEGLVIALEGQSPVDEFLADGAVAGLLDLPRANS